MSNYPKTHRVFTSWVVFVMILNLVSAPLASVAYAAAAPLNSDAPLILNESTVSEAETVVEESVVDESTVVEETPAEQVVSEVESVVEEVVEVAPVVEVFAVEEVPGEQVVSGVESIVENTTVTQSPELTTDKEDYHPGETANIFGKFFGALQTFVLKIFGSDENSQNYTESTQTVTTDDAGSFSSTYTLDNLYRPFYEVVATDLEGGLLASTWFRDSSIGTYDQCSQDDGDGYASGDTGCRWINGNLNSNNSTYFEGDSTVQRMWIEGYAPGSTHTVTFKYGTTKAGTHAYDYLTTWSNSEPWIIVADRCDGIAGCTTASEATIPMQNDPNAPDTIEPTPASRLFTARGGTLNSVTIPAIASGSYAGDSETEVTISFTVANSGSMCSTKGQVTSCGIAIWFGAHVAKTSEWQPYNGTTGAGFISGSPYHVQLAAEDGASIGNRDNQMQSNTLPSQIIIRKVTDPVSDPQTFTFTKTGNGNGYTSPYNLTGGNSNTQTVTPKNNQNTYIITEGVVAQWNLTNISCQDNSAVTTTTVNLANRQVTIVLDIDSSSIVDCTFTNNKVQNGTIIVDKVTLPAADSQSFNFDAVGGSYADFSLTDAVTPNSQVLVAGNYSVSETVPTGWTQTSATCVSSIADSETVGSIELDPGETVTCTFINTKKGHIIVDKVTVPTADSQSFSFTTTGAGYNGFSLTDANAANNQEVVPGAYSVAEGAVVGWTSDGGVCDSGETPASLDVGPGETVTCTFTNTKLGKIIVEKQTLPDGDSQVFDFNASWDAGVAPDFQLSDGQTNDSGFLTAGNYSVSETVPTGWVLTSAICSDSSAVGSISLQAGETVTCVFTNTKQAHIIVDKITDPSGDPQSFDFTAGGAGYSNFSLTDAGAPNNQQVAPGAYSVSESVPAGWDLTSATCDSGETVESIDVEPGETVTCTFTNTKRGHIIVDKVTNPAQDPQIFNFTTDAGSNFSLTDQAAAHDSGAVVPGTYSVAETLPTGWIQTSATCDDGSPVGAISLQAGETVTCTFTNTKKGSITIIKNTVGDNGTFNFTTTGGNGLPAGFGITTTSNTGSQTYNDIDPGSYSVAESIPAGWILTSATCTSGVPAGFTLPAGGSVTCTFNNTAQGKIVINKVAVGGDATFGYTVTGPTGSAQSITTSGGAGTTGNITVTAGGYSVSESTIPTGWDLTTATCTSGTPAAFTVHANETVTCTFTNVKRGNIIVEKQTDPNGDPQVFDFTTSYDQDGFSLSDNQTNDSGLLVPGSYSVSETVLAGWDLESAVCSDQSPVNAISLQAGETVTCVFTNEKDAQIIVVKQTNPDGDNQVFNFTASYDGDGFSLSDGQSNDSGDLDPGTYSVAETVPAGWDLESATCTDGTPASMSLQAGETITCTFTNEKDAFIIVEKQTLPDGDSQVFDFDLSYGDGDADLSDGQTDNSGDLAPGVYTVSENTPAGWDLTNVTCSDGSLASSISLQAGETITCTFTNTKRAHIIIQKNAIPDSNTQAFTFNNNFGNGNPVSFNLTDTTAAGLPSYNAEVIPGKYAVSEDPVVGWQLDSATCDSSETVGDIDVGPGETVTCTFTNEKLAKIILVKNTVGGNDTFTFAMTGTGLPSSDTITTSGNTGTDEYDNLNPDLTYSIAETPIPAGWAKTGATCDNGDPVTAITPNAGEVITCTFINNKPAAQIDVTPLTLVNRIGDNHIISVNVQVHNGDGVWGPAVDGTVVTFSITNSLGATAVFVPASPDTCTTTSGTCSITINSPTAGHVAVNASATPVVLGVNLPVATGTGGLNSADAQKDYVNARISIEESATNEVDDAHSFTVKVEQSVADGVWTNVEGALVDVVVSPAPDSLIETDCNDGTAANGTCTATINSAIAGVFTARARTTIMVNSVEFKLQTNGVGENSDPAVKTYVDASIALNPLEATNAINDPHTITATVTQNDGQGVDPAVGVTVTFSVTSGTATFVGNDNDCVTNGSGQCSVQIVSGTTGSNSIDATTTFSVGGVSLTRATDGDYGPDGTGSAGKDYVNARISITPEVATNQVDEAHNFTVTVEQDTGSGFVPVAAGTLANAIVNPATSINATDCTDGVNASGQCTVTINSSVAGVFTVIARSTVVVNGVEFKLQTNGVGDNSGPAVKTYVDAKISVDPQQATNNINDPHTITATVMEDDGLGYDPAAGETVTFTLVNNTAGAAFVGAVDTCVTDVSGQCAVDINTSTPGSVEIHASVDAVVSTEVVHRESDSTHGSSGNGTKVYVAGKIFVQKVTVGGDDSFEFDPSYATNFFLSNGGSNDSGFLAPGNYSVAEVNLPDGWDLTSATCNDDDGSDPASIVLDADEEVTCVFINTARGKIIVEKQTLPDGSSQSFDFAADYDNDGFGLTDGVQNDSGYIVAGTYAVSETVPTGWDQTSATCSDQSPVNAISLQPGETVTCIFTNTERGHLIVEKTTLPGGDLTEFSINAAGTGTVTGGGAGTITDANDHDYEVTPGTYSVTETVPAGWDKTGDTCQGVVVAPGETKTCTITNTKRGSITIVKDADPNDAQDFQFAGTLGAFTLDDDGGVQDAPNPDQYENSETFNNLVAGQDYTVTETLPNQYWVLDSVTCVNTADQTPYEVASTTNGVVITLVPGADVTCTYQNDKISPTRTQGFWQTHTTFTSATFATYFAGGMQIGGGIHKGLITNIQATGQSQLYGAYFSNIAKKTNNSQRLAIDKARMQLLQQLVTAKLNCAAFGCSSSVQGMIVIADIVYASGTAAQIIISAGLLDAYNNSGDTIIIGNAGKATPKTSQGYANKVFWDLP